uniref:Uncharacterized protein n=1 Tax=Anguilla anguilla TaxID=7936 RepID=A0A0E9REI6_ANGAN
MNLSRAQLRRAGREKGIFIGIERLELFPQVEARVSFSS